MTLLFHADGRISVSESGAGRRRISVEPRDGIFVARRQWETAYPEELILQILQLKGVGHLCDEIAREESPLYVQRNLALALGSYLPFAELDGARILDFGCGAGASAVVMARLLPKAEIVGVELDENHLKTARCRARFRGLDNVRFDRSPTRLGLPSFSAPFDYVVLSEVYEHLLPDERGPLLTGLWSTLARHGVMFVFGTPNRWFPLEKHTTGLPGINYLPDGAAAWLARRASRRVGLEETWDSMLRRGIRGATLGEILRRLDAGAGVEVLEPCLGVDDRIELWRELSRPGGREVLKEAMALVFRVAHVFGLDLTPTLTLALRKVEES